jgi:hypothetical protein
MRNSPIKNGKWPSWPSRLVSWFLNDYETGALGHFAARRDRRTKEVSIYIPWYYHRLRVAGDIAVKFEVTEKPPV